MAMDGDKSKRKEAEFKGLSGPYVAGGALWLYARHPWATAAFYADGNLISPYGSVSRDRKTRFPALSVVERLFKERAVLTNSRAKPKNDP